MSSNDELRKEWDKRLNFYFYRIRWNSGCGKRGQDDIDRVHNSLITFTEEHPEFASNLPPLAKIHDDGHGGMMCGLSALGKTWIKE